MVQVQIVISSAGEKLRIEVNNLAREDADDVEVELANAFEQLLKNALAGVAEVFGAEITSIPRRPTPHAADR